MKCAGLLILTLCGFTVAQFSDLDQGAVPRPPAFRRQRFQAAPAPNAIRLRRPSPPRISPQPVEPTPPAFTQAHLIPLEESPAPPPAVEEVIEEDEFELEEPGPRPAVFAPRPPPGSRPVRPVFHQAPLPQDTFRSQPARPSPRPVEQDLAPITVRPPFRAPPPSSATIQQDIALESAQPQIRPPFRAPPPEQDFSPVTARPQTRPSFRPPPPEQDFSPVTVRPQTRPSFRPPPPEQDLSPVTVRPQTRPPFRPPPPEQDQTARPQTRPPFSPQPPEQEQRQQRPAYRSEPAPQKTIPVRKQQQFPRPSKESQREKKPVSQVLRRYREDNPDGSITWGFENDDGTFKEETIGVDCMVRGKYGYYDPDGVRREYSYSSGIPCDKENNKDEGFIDYQTNKYVLPNGDKLDLDSVIKPKARRPTPSYRQ